MRTLGAANAATSAASVIVGAAPAPRPSPMPSVFLYRDRAGRAPVDRLAQPVAELLGRVLVQHVEVPVVAHLEDLGQDAHAHGVAGTLVEVHDDLHRDLLVRGIGSAEHIGRPEHRPAAAPRSGGTARPPPVRASRKQPPTWRRTATHPRTPVPAPGAP